MTPKMGVRIMFFLWLVLVVMIVLIGIVACKSPLDGKVTGNTDPTGSSKGIRTWCTLTVQPDDKDSKPWKRDFSADVCKRCQIGERYPKCREERTSGQRVLMVGQRLRQARP